MSNLKFNLPKFKIEKNQYADDLINYWAAKFHLYDNRFPEEEQCGGYFAFRNLCLRKEPPPKSPFKIRSEAIWVDDIDINHLHVNIRESATNAAYFVRKRIKKEKENEAHRNRISGNETSLS